MQSAPSKLDVGLDDASLIRAFRAGDAAALDVLFQRHYADLVRFLRVRLGDEAAAEDVAQDTMIRAMRAIETFDCDRPIGPWLRQIARNAGIDALRARGRTAAMTTALRHQRPVHATAADQAMGDMAEVDLLRRALGDVPDRQRQALVRCYVEGWRPSEAAADFGVCSNAFEQLLHRARANLRRAYLRHDGHDRAAGLVWTLLAVVATAQRRAARLVRLPDLLPGVGQVVASGVVAASLTVGAGLGGVAPTPTRAPVDPVSGASGATTLVQPVEPVPPSAADISAAVQAPPSPDVPGTTVEQRPAPVALDPAPTAQEGPAIGAGVPLPGGGRESEGGPPSGTTPDTMPGSTAGPAAEPVPVDQGLPQAMGGCGSVVRSAVCAADEQAVGTLSSLS